MPSNALRNDPGIFRLGLLLNASLYRIAQFRIGEKKEALQGWHRLNSVLRASMELVGVYPTPPLPAAKVDVCRRDERAKRPELYGRRHVVPQ
jgi:hypothetical protein